MVILYDIFFVIFSLLYLPYLFLKGKAHRGLWQRLGFIGSPGFQGGAVWIHAVSVGEAGVAALLVKALRKRINTKIVVSTVTASGNNLARKLIGQDAEFIYAPLDVSFIVGRFIDKIKPRLCIIVETELWPNLIYGLHKRKVPVVLINGRISPKSFKGYKMIRCIVRKILGKIDFFFMQTPEDKNKICALGAPEDKVKVTGNMKFDGADDALASAAAGRGYKIKLGFGADDKIWVAGSTHPSEEKAILAVYKRLLTEFPELKLLIAPRHIERAIEIKSLVAKFGFVSQAVSEIVNPQSPITLPTGQAGNNQILILDTIGELKNTYSIAEVVFVGGGLIKKGGQNILEPAVFAKPIIFGPHMFNFAWVASLFLAKNAAIEVKNERELEAAARRVLADRQYAQGLGARAREALLENRGATQRNLELIKALI